MRIGLLFDLDGTLLNTLEDLTDATNFALTAFGYPERSLSEVRAFIGNGAENQIRLSLPTGAAPEEVQRVLAVYKAYYTDHCQIKTAPYPGVMEALEALRDFPIAIVSNKPDSAVNSLCARYFPGIFALGEIPGCPRKPAPDMLHRAMTAIGAETCIYIGDSEVDVRTARNAGVPCLSVAWGFRDRETLECAGAKHLCDDPHRLANALVELAAGLS